MLKKNMDYLNVIINKIDTLTVYRDVMEDRVIWLIKKLCNLENTDLYFSELCFLLIKNAEENGFCGNILKKYIINLFLNDENIFSLYCENNREVRPASLYRLALMDIDVMKTLCSLNLSYLPLHSTAGNEIMDYKGVNKAENETVNLVAALSSTEEILDVFIDYYKNLGCGNISRFKMFKYDIGKGIIGIPNSDPIVFDDIIGYRAQIDPIIANTKAFVQGYPANNVLLVGSRGTGKSSCVKALANMFFESGLRLIEITKEQMVHIHRLLSILKGRGRRFIIFIDDLSFDEHEIQYKLMKSLLEGGSESKPDNVLFYATSNRRHLVQEKWSDRNDSEIHKNDNLNEKLSLADRFGITITFPKPTPKEYMDIVFALAEKSGIDLSRDELKREAVKWELNQKGMSGRTAKQFINNLVWETSKE